MPKYSIIIPAYNGMPYLKYCVESIISQNYDDYELIISEDHSTDGTAEYIDSLNCYSKVKILHCPVKMSMSEHWEYAQSFASGDWQIFVGQDDGLQGYFFELADILINICNRNNLEVIMSERAYYFYSGCEDTYGNIKVSFFAKNEFEILNVKNEVKNALYKKTISYMDFPCMYTTSLFKKTFIDRVKKIQNEKLFTTHPQDANLAAIVAVFQKYYIKSYIPLGWVGSSPKSAGLAISNYSKENELANDYLRKVNNSNLKRHPLAGDFKLPSHPIYFWSALLSVSEKFNNNLYKKIISKKMKIKIFSNAIKDMKNDKLYLFYELLRINNISESELDLNRRNGNFITSIFTRVFNRIKLFFGKLKNTETFYISYKHNEIDCTILDLNNIINENIKNWFCKYK